jgi:quinol-cytochrome oxidoreductase complex cytochrome b subunit
MPNPNVESLKAANSLTSQLITVAAGLLAFTVTFVEKFTPRDEALSPPTSLKISWVAFAITIVLGFYTSMAIVGTLSSETGGPYDKNIVIPACLMFLSFLVGVGFLIAAGWVIAGA